MAAAKQLALVLGGTHSGKSSYALQLAKEAGGRVLYVATADAGDGDPEMEQRIRDHRRVRPSDWDTVEATAELVAEIEPLVGGYETVLIDSLTLWVSRLVVELEGSEGAEQTITGKARDLLGLYERGEACWIIVSDEVGAGVVPPTPLGRAFRDVLGRVHQLVASRADELYYTVAGHVLPLKALGARQIPVPGPEEPH